MADRGGLENRCPRERTLGSNPSLSVLKYYNKQLFIIQHVSLKTFSVWSSEELPGEFNSDCLWVFHSAYERKLLAEQEHWCLDWLLLENPSLVLIDRKTCE